MTHPLRDPVLLIALVNEWARRERQATRGCPQGSAEARQHAEASRRWYDLKALALARLAHEGRIELSLVDTHTAKPAALVLGYSPHLRFHAFHLPIASNRWALKLPLTYRRWPSLSTRRRRRILEAHQTLNPDEVVAALLALPPLPPHIARAWGFTRPTWGEIEAERASAPGGVPRPRRRQQ